MNFTSCLNLPGNKWSDCSVSCGVGTATKGDNVRSCHALCENETVRYCNLPQFPEDNWLDHGGPDNRNWEVFAEYPLRKSYLGKTTMICTPPADGVGGYWAKDPLGASDDEYYIMRHGEICRLSCDSSLFDRPHKLSRPPFGVPFIKCNAYGKLDDTRQCLKSWLLFQAGQLGLKIFLGLGES